jgi:hypothetical protein
MLKIPAEYNSDTSPEKLTVISGQFLSASLPDISAGICQRSLVGESGMIKTQMGTHNRSENDRSARTLCMIPPRNSKQ